MNLYNQIKEIPFKYIGRFAYLRGKYQKMILLYSTSFKDVENKNLFEKAKFIKEQCLSWKNNKKITILSLKEDLEHCGERANVLVLMDDKFTDWEIQTIALPFLASREWKIPKIEPQIFRLEK